MLTDTSLLLAGGAALAWGVWALFVRLAQETLLPETVVVVSYLTGGLVATGYLLWTPETASWSAVGAGYAVAAGLATGVGSLLYYTALRSADVGIVSTVTGLYFVVAAALGVVVLDEGVTVEKAVGILFAAAAVVMFTR